MRVRILSAVCALLCVVGGLLLTCSDPPNKPVSEIEYPFYFVGSSNSIYRYHPSSRRVDTAVLQYRAYPNMAVSADGKSLYLPYANSTVVVSSDSFSFITELHYPSNGGVAVSPNGEMVAIQGTDLNILSTHDYSVLYHDTVGSNGGVFSANSKSFYGLGGHVVFRLDIQAGVKGFGKSFSPHMVWTVVPTNDETKLLLSTGPTPCSGRFLIYDIVNDSIIYNRLLDAAPNRIVITPDGKYAFATSPGVIRQDCGPPPSSILMFDIEKNVLHEDISTEGLIGDSLHDYLPVDAMAVSPDGKLMIACASLGGGDFIIFDLSRELIVDRNSVGNRTQLYWAACQNGR